MGEKILFNSNLDKWQKFSKCPNSLNADNQFLHREKSAVFYQLRFRTGLKRGPKHKTEKKKQSKDKDSGSSATDSSLDEDEERPLKRKSMRKKKMSKSKRPAFLSQTSSGRTPKATLRFENSVLK